jgi:hypothetical protein
MGPGPRRSTCVDIGITFNTPPEDGVVVIDDRVHIGREIEAIREPTDLHGKD